VSQFIQQQPFEAINYNTNSHGSSLHTPTASVPTFTTDGMMLNDEEIASIAGLNAYLDNGRFYEDNGYFYDIKIR